MKIIVANCLRVLGLTLLLGLSFSGLDVHSEKWWMLLTMSQSCAHLAVVIDPWLPQKSPRKS